MIVNYSKWVEESQTNAKRVLCVCSAGMLRSPTLAIVLHREFGYNTRSCGSKSEFALIPITDNLIYWADEIVFVNQENYDELSDADKYLINVNDTEITILNIPDRYNWMENELQYTLLNHYKWKHKL
jgi:predicted protein tyrosine phosphatase